MRTKARNRSPSALGLITSLLAGLFAGDGASSQEQGRFALDTTFTYQGRLQHDGLPAEGRFDLSFELFDAPRGGNSLGRIDAFDAAVRGGAFAAELDFGRSIRSGEPVWLEIHVRAAGEGGYTILEPRSHLAGEGVSSCVVDADVLINGTLDIDPIGNEVALDIACCNEATLDGGGQIVLGGFLQSLGIDNSEIQSRSLGAGAAFWINPQGGNVGLGITATPQAPLQLPSGPDASPSGGGSLVIGPPSGTNLAFDNNEIMARNNGSTSTLYLNNDGGDVVVGGRLHIGVVEVIAEEHDVNYVFAHCPSGKFLLGGGCGCHGDEDIRLSRPWDSNTWYCNCTGTPASLPHTAHAICGRVSW